MQHGQPRYFLVGDELYSEGSNPIGSQSLVASRGLRTQFASVSNRDLAVGETERLFHYGRMFRRPYLPQYRPEPESLIALGLAMKETEDPDNPQAAMIIDSRNDENLAIAQTHLAFIKFHNAVVEHLSDTVWHADLFESVWRIPTAKNCH